MTKLKWFFFFCLAWIAYRLGLLDFKLHLCGNIEFLGPTRLLVETLDTEECITVNPGWEGIE